MGKQCWSQAVLVSGSWGHSVLQTPALVFFFCFYLLEKISPDISCEFSARQMIHMKCQDIFTLKVEKNELDCRLLQILFCTLWVKCVHNL